MTETTTLDLTHRLEKTVDTWLQAYGETDAATRAALIEQVWAPDGVLVDPPFTGTGHAEITDLAGAAQGQFPGHTFRRTSELDAHHDLARYTWELVGPDGTPAVAGTDVVLVGEDGRLRYVAGFFGEPA
ncbi:MAG TPA: nuclear transport factor 2 family protein, partial [Sporichthya sp.]|nr:nuclear transport factor 2 family protein [Sporichthya sp.]